MPPSADAEIMIGVNRLGNAGHTDTAEREKRQHVGYNTATPLTFTTVVLRQAVNTHVMSGKTRTPSPISATKPPTLLFWSMI